MKRFLFVIAIVTQLLGGGVPVSQAAPHGIVLASVAQPGGWIASPATTDCSVGPRDSASRFWYDPAFDDSGWTPVVLEDLNSIPAGSARYYRTVINIIGTPQLTRLQLTSDDGLWLYINNTYVNHWGGNCVSSGLSGTVLVDITGYLHTGENVIAVRVSNVIVGSGFNAVIPWQISYPDEVRLTAKILSTPDCPGIFGIDSPVHLVGDSKVMAHAGLSFSFATYFPKNTPLRFYYTPTAPCQAGTYYSDDPRYAKLSKTSSGNWEIDWSDYQDWNYSHLKIELSSSPAVTRFLDLPFDYSGFSSFVRAVSDVDKNGTVNSYFDHHYPNYGADGRIVTFQGYDSTVDQPGFGLAYDGHDGIDFVVPGGNVQVLPAASGNVALHPESSYTSACYCAALKTTVQHCLGNYVVVTHANSYETTYAHLSPINPDLIEGQAVTRATALGTMGSTGCSTGPHIHFQLTNPDGVVVDPFGWLAKQFPTSAYAKSGAADPWVTYNADLPVPKNAISSYLWNQPLIVSQLNNPDANTVATSPSNSAQITLAPGAAGSTPFQVDVIDSLGFANLQLPFGIPGMFVDYYVYGPDYTPIWTLTEPAQVRFDLSNAFPNSFQPDRLAFVQEAWEPAYSVYIWDSEVGAWTELDAVHDPDAKTLTVETTLVGQMVVLEDKGFVYLPVVTR